MYIFGTAALVALLIIIYATLIEPYLVRISRVNIPIENLPESLDGFTICHMSDLHLSRYGRLERRVSEILAGMEADICVFTGDLINTESGFEPLRRIVSSARTRFGVFAVPGNGDYKMGLPIESVAKEWKKAGVEPLINANTLLPQGINLVGVGDPFIGADNVESAASDIEPGVPTIMLAHSPDILMRLGSFGPDLILAGHTHGGQVRLPFLPPLWLHCRYRLGISDGLFRISDLGLGIADLKLPRSWLYVSRGVSSTLLRLRFFCPPEMVLVTLVSETR